MQTTLTKSSCVRLRIEWKIPKIKQHSSFFLSKKVSYQKNDLFRVGVKKPSHTLDPVTFVFLTDVNLKKNGTQGYVSLFYK